MKFAGAVIIGISALISTECMAQAKDKSVENAFLVCAWLDNIDILSEECDVSGWHSTVTAKADITSGEARELCAKVASLAKQKGLVFDAKWRMKVYSPFSGDNAIASCKLS